MSTQGYWHIHKYSLKLVSFDQHSWIFMDKHLLILIQMDPYMLSLACAYHLCINTNQPWSKLIDIHWHWSILFNMNIHQQHSSIFVSIDQWINHDDLQRMINIYKCSCIFKWLSIWSLWINDGMASSSIKSSFWICTTINSCWVTLIHTC